MLLLKMARRKYKKQRRALQQRLKKTHQVRRERLRQRHEKVEIILAKKAIKHGSDESEASKASAEEIESSVWDSQTSFSKDESVIQPMTFEEMMGAGAKVISLKTKQELTDEAINQTTSKLLRD